MKLLRTIALDPSDTFVFDVAAEPGDWAVSGAFRFCDRDPAELTRQGPFGVPQRLSRGAVLGLVDTGADRPRDRRRSPDAGGTPCRRSLSTASARRILQPRALRPKRKSPLRSRSARILSVADRGPPLGDRWRGPRVIPQIATAGGPAVTARRSRSWRSRMTPSPTSDLDLAEHELEPRAPMKDFWISCGHHLLDRNASGGLVVTDEFLKAYFARPELMPPDDACAVERRLHRELLADPRRPVGADEVAAIADADARENWQFVLAFRDLLLRHPTLEAAYLALVRSGSDHPAAAVCQSARSRDPAKRAGRLRGPVRAARGRAVFPAAADHAARTVAASWGRGDHWRAQARRRCCR